MPGRQHQRHRISEPNVFRGVNHDAAGDETRVFAGVNHFGQPVECRVRVAATHRLDERRNGVIVRVFVSIINHRLFLNALLRDGKINVNETVIGRCRGQRGDFDRVQRFARIAVSDGRQVPQCRLIRFDFQVTEPAFTVGQSALEEVAKFVHRQGMQFENLRS